MSAQAQDQPHKMRRLSASKKWRGLTIFRRAGPPAYPAQSLAIGTPCPVQSQQRAPSGMLWPDKIRGGHLLLRRLARICTYGTVLCFTTAAWLAFSTSDKEQGNAAESAPPAGQAGHDERLAAHAQEAAGLHGSPHLSRRSPPVRRRNHASQPHQVRRPGARHGQHVQRRPECRPRVRHDHAEAALQVRREAQRAR